MQSPWKQLHPQDSFRVKLARPVTSYDEQLLSFLYQPLIGVDAFSIYHLLLTLIDQDEFDSPESLHADLFSQLNIELPRLFYGRVKLEGIGLLKVFVKEKDQRRAFIYELQRPLEAAAFFQDDVLSLLLLNSVGERRYQQLVTRFAIPTVNREQFTEVTKKFLDVYELNQESLSANEKVLAESQRKFPALAEEHLSTVSSTFDWTYFLSLIDGLYLDKEQLESELKETIYTLHHLYGINELEMKGFVESEVDFVTNKVQVNRLRQQVISKYHRNQKQHEQAQSQEMASLSADDQVKRRQNTLQLEGFAAGEIEVILASESISPMIYMSAIRKQKGGFITNNERWALETIVKKSGLPDSVINILIHYILVVQDSPTFDEKYASKIANDWAQGQIFTPEGALQKVKDLGSQAETRRTQRQSRPTSNWGGAKSGRKETLPDWATQTKVETPVTQEEAAYFKEQLRLLRSSGEEGES